MTANQRQEFKQNAAPARSHPVFLSRTISLDSELQGLSFRELLVNPNASWERPALTSTKAGNHTVRSERWRYIRYHDGSEELYDHTKDPNEWTNLADRPELHEIKVQHAQWIDTLTEGEIIK